MTEVSRLSAGSVTACTIVARNYWAHARVLATSFLEHHPDGRMYVLVLDDVDAFMSDDGEDFTLLRPADIGIDTREFHRMAAIYEVLELATAVKPWLLRTLLESGSGSVIYLDPDIEVFAPLDPLADLAATEGLVLTPHTLEPMNRDGLAPDESAILMSGVYNLGFVAVGPRSRPFLDWWSERLRRDCIVAVDKGMFVDQRWVDFVPGYFPHHIVHDPCLNVAYWNLAQRHVTWTGDRYDVDGRPLVFFHYSGFDPGKPGELSRFQRPEPRVRLDTEPALARLCRRYAGKLDRAGYYAWSGVRYGFGRTPGGMRLDRRARRLYRAALVESEQSGSPQPPNPFDPGGNDPFIGWLNQSADPHVPRVSRYLRQLHNERADLRASFPELGGPDSLLYLRWAERDAAAQGTPRQLASPGRVRDLGLGGVNVAGYLRAESGVGEGARLLIDALRGSEIPHVLVPYTRTRSRQEEDVDLTAAGQPVYDTNIVCVNADQTAIFLEDAGPDLVRGRYTVGMWAWEVEEFPDWMAHATELVDEIWLGSAHAARAVAAKTTKPVFAFPLPIPVRRPPPRDRRSLGLPDGFLVTFCFDFDSVFERKNPLSAIAAFSRAFPSDAGAHLVIKTVNGHAHPVELELLCAAAEKHPGVAVRDGYVSKDEQLQIVAASDAYLSLHRAEGFGLTIAEAMALGTPVVATAYSGTLEFADEKNAWLVPYELVPVPPGNDPYPATARWAEPDVDAAADMLRTIRKHPDLAAKRAARATADLERLHSPRARGVFLRERLEAIGDGRPMPEPPPDPFLFETSDARGRRVWAPADAVADHLARGPDLDAPTGHGSLSRMARKIVLRALQHYREHQDRIDEGLLRAVRELAEQNRALVDALREFDARAVLEAEEAEAQAKRVRDLKKQVMFLADVLDAQPYLSDPLHLRTTDPRGRDTIGYSGAQRDLIDDLTKGFADIFRGPEDFIRERQRVYLDILSGRGPVLDVGCGRGEMLDLLAEHGIEAWGIDSDAGMVDRCRRKGHRAELGDAAAYLGARPDASAGAIFSAQVVEHFAHEELLGFLEQAHRTLRPGGVLIAETVNPHSVRALKTFWLDPTHIAPLFPETLVVLCAHKAFDDAYVVFPGGTGKLEEDRLVQGEYAVVATKAG